MKIEDFKKYYDRLQTKYGAETFNPIYSGGCEKYPDIFFIFMNTTGKKYCK